MSIVKDIQVKVIPSDIANKFIKKHHYEILLLEKLKEFYLKMNYHLKMENM